MEARARALQALIRLRKTEVDQAKAALARMLAEEHAALGRLETRRAAIETERRETLVGQVSSDDFRLWLPAGREAVESAETMLHAARCASDQAREALMRANAALKAAEAILDKRLEEEREMRTRREQAEIDDLSRRGRVAAG